MTSTELTKEEIEVCEQACAFIKENKQELIKTFILDKKPLKLDLVTIFMAGSPGAGKTEFAKRYIPRIIQQDNLARILKKQNLKSEDVDQIIVHIDIDEIRRFIPQYTATDIDLGTKGNAHVVQKAAAIGLDFVRNYCLDNKISFLHDGTFSNYYTMEEIVNKSIKLGREVHINYIYLDPVTAWENTKAREFFEGRNILKEKFITQYFKSKESVQRIKDKFKEKVKIYLILKNNKDEVEETFFNKPNIDLFLEAKYNDGTLKRYTPEELSEILN